MSVKDSFDLGDNRGTVVVYNDGSTHLPSNADDPEPNSYDRSLDSPR